MSKNDISLIVVVLLISIFGVFFLTNNKNGSTAQIYYDGNLIKEVSLNIDDKFEVDGELGVVEIEVKDGKIRVTKETSPKHLCSLQGFISNKYESIICLPNKVVIEIKNSELDTIVK